MTYEKKSVIELREIAKERKIKGISTLKKQELIKVLENYDQEQSKQKEEPQIQREPKQSYSEHQERKHHQKEFPKNIKSLDSGEKAHGILEKLCQTGMVSSDVKTIFQGRMISMYLRLRSANSI